MGHEAFILRSSFMAFLLRMNGGILNGGNNMKKLAVAVMMMIGVVAYAKSMKIEGKASEYSKVRGAAKETKVQKVFNSYIYFEEGSDIIRTETYNKYKFEYKEVKEKKRNDVKKEIANEILELVVENTDYEEQRSKFSDNQIGARSVFSDINHRGYYTDSLASISFSKNWTIEFEDYAKIEELVKNNYKVWFELPCTSLTSKENLDIESKLYGITIYYDFECDSFYVLNYLEVED